MLNRSTIRDARPYRDWEGGLLMSALCAIIASFLSLHIMQKVGVFTDPPIRHLLLLIDAAACGEQGHLYLNWLREHIWRALAYYGAAVMAATLAGWASWSWFGRIINPVQHVAGGRLLRGVDAASEARNVTANEVRASGYGLKFHPNLQLARHQELTSFLFLAGQRGGKTQILTRLLQPAWARGDKTIAFDFKTDFTEITPPTKEGKNPILFAPWDARTAVWDVAKDVRAVQHARAFAAGVVVGGDENPMWANASRALLVAVIMKQIAERGTAWGWEELGRDAYLPISALKRIAEQYYPPAVVIVADAESKTTQSVMINLHAFLSPLFDLRAMWGSLPISRRVSFDAWLRDDKTKFKNIVIQGSTEHPELARAYIKSIIETCVSILGAPTFPQSQARRIWWVMDEFVQFGKIECIQRIPEVFASRGCSLIVTAQSIDQIERDYGREVKAIFSNVFNTKIFGRITGASDAAWVQEQASKRRISKPTRTVSGQGKGQVTVTQGSIEEEIEVIRKEDLARLGMVSRGRKGVESKPEDIYIRAIVLGHGINALELEWPLFQHKKWRADHVPVPKKQVKVNQTPRSSTANFSHGHAVSHQSQPGMPEPTAQPQLASEDEVANEILSILDAGVSVVNLPPENASKEPAENSEHTVVNEIASEAIVHAIAEATGINETLLNAIHEVSEAAGDGKEVVASTEFVGLKKRQKKPRSYEATT